jgi:hypothetical protein
LIPRAGILPAPETSLSKRRRKAVTDLIYLALGAAVLAVFGLYAAGLKRI